MDGTTYDAVKPNLEEQLRPDAVVASMGRRYPELDRMHALIRGKRQIGVAAPELPTDSFVNGPVKSISEICSPGEGRWRQLLFVGIPFTFRPRAACARLLDDLSGDLLSRARSLAVKDELDRRCGGRMPARIDSTVRIGQSVWESADGRERIVFVYNFDYDDAEDAVLKLDQVSTAERLEPDGNWKPAGRGRDLPLPTIPAWSVVLLRLRSAPAAVTGERPLEEVVDAAFAGHWKFGFSERTSLLHGCPTNRVKPLAEFTNGVFDWYKGIPGGYGNGIDDCALNHGVALSGCVDRWDALTRRRVASDDPRMAQTAEWAAKLAQGLLNLSSRHGFKGFVARGLCWEDGKSICSLSSIDQHTHWVHGLWRYVHSPMARKEIVEECRRRAVEVAARMERTVVPERDYNFGLCDGRPEPRGICKMWWGGEPRTGCCRLASIYAFAYDLSRDPHWKAMYEKIADVACLGAAKMDEEKANTPGWVWKRPTYCLLQHSSACEMLLGVERDPSRRANLQAGLRMSAVEANARARRQWKDPSVKWYGMCAEGEMALAQLMDPDFREAGFIRDFLSRAVRTRKPNGQGWGTFAVTHFFAAWWRARARDAEVGRP